MCAPKGYNNNHDAWAEVNGLSCEMYSLNAVINIKNTDRIALGVK